jgi:hypothetical protein
MPGISPRGWIGETLARAAQRIALWGVGARGLSVAGFAVGLAALPSIATRHTWLGLVFILVGRGIAGLGAIARFAREGEGDADLSAALDSIFLASVPFAFALGDPGRALSAAFLLFGIVAVCAASLVRARPERAIGMNDAIAGIAGCSLACLFPDWFSVIAYALGIACFAVAGARIAFRLARGGA